MTPDLIELPPPEGEDVRHPVLWLAAVTALAAVLRFYRLGSDLWLDEIATVIDYRDAPLWSVFTTFKSLNNHPLNSLLAKASVAVFGQQEWAIRLPAALFGIAGVPAVYGLARVAVKQREAIFAAFLLAVSYHHVFFSQNGRGYTGMLFWSTLGTTFFLRAITRGRVSDFFLYTAAMFLAAATVLPGVLIAGGHALAFAGAAAARRRRGTRSGALALRLLAAWTALGLLCLAAYAALLPKLSAFAAASYRSAAGGYAPFSLDYVGEVWRGLVAGLGPAERFLALPVLAVGAAGFVLFVRRHVFYAAVLLAPLFATAAYLLASRLNFTPRFFLWALPVAWIFAAAAAVSLEGWLASRRGMSAPARALPYLLLAAAAAISAASLPAYYRTPKQPNRASLDWALAERRAGDPIVAAHQARWGLRFYGPARGLKEGESAFEADNLGELAAIERASRGETIWLLTTFPRGLKLDRPDLDRYIRDNYQERRRFPATVGDASVTVWTRRLAP